LTVSTTNSFIEYTGNASATTFPVPFMFLADSDLVVTSTTADGVTTTTLVKGTDYTVIGAGAQAGGAILVGMAPAVGVTLAITRVLNPIQETDLRNQGRFYAETHEKVFDRLTMLIQQAFAGISRALKRPIGKAYFDAEGRVISNLADPVADQDATTKKWVSTYFGNLIDGVTGAVNTTKGIAYDAGTLFDYLRFGVGRSVDSIDSLRSLSSARNQRAFVLSYYGDSKRGGGPYRVDSSDTTSADNGGTIIIGADGARWKRLPQTPVDVCTFGAKVDGVADDTAAVLANIAWLPSAGGRITIPDGDMLISAELAVTNKPIVFSGRGRSLSRIVQTASGANGINFKSTLTGNRIAGTSISVSLRVEGLSIIRKDLVNGGIGVKASWLPGTDNRPYFEFIDSSVESNSDATTYWAKGIELTDCCGSRLFNPVVKGDSASNASTTTALPFGMTHAIHYLGSTGQGKINHFLSNIAGGECNNFLTVEGWYEGFYITCGELVHVGRAFYLNGYATSKNPNFYVSNVHADVRVSGVSATNTNNIQLLNCDLYKAVSGAGFAGQLVSLSNCDNFKLIGTKLENVNSANTNGVYADGSCTGGIISGSTIKGMNGSGIALIGTCSNWMLGPTSLESNGTAIFTGNTTSDITVGLNNYKSNTTNLAIGGPAHIAKRTWVGSPGVTFATAAAVQTFNIAVPAGQFLSAPSAIVADGTGDNNLSFSQDTAASTATSLKMYVRRIDGANVPAATYKLSVFAGEI
jgi:hypothetical protein